MNKTFATTLTAAAVLIAGTDAAKINSEQFVMKSATTTSPTTTTTTTATPTTTTSPFTFKLGGTTTTATAPAPAPAPAAAPAPAPRPPAPPAPAPAAATKVTYAADAFFDFDKAVLKPEGKAKLDDLVGKIKAINLEVIIAVGHTDSVGADAYNQKLSVRRADAVKAYLVTKGIEKNRVYTEGKGEKQPVADNKTDAGRSKNRRVEIEVVGTRPNR